MHILGDPTKCVWLENVRNGQHCKVSARLPVQIFGFGNGQTFVAATLALWHDHQRCYRKLSLSLKPYSLSHKTPVSALHSSLRSYSGFCPPALCWGELPAGLTDMRADLFRLASCRTPRAPVLARNKQGSLVRFCERVQPVKVAGRSAERVGKHCGQLTRFWVQTSGYFSSRKWRVTHSPCQNWPTSFDVFFFLFLPVSVVPEAWLWMTSAVTSIEFGTLNLVVLQILDIATHWLSPHRNLAADAPTPELPQLKGSMQPHHGQNKDTVRPRQSPSRALVQEVEWEITIKI